MSSDTATVQQYLDALPPERKPVFEELLSTVQKNLPTGFQLTMTYGLPGFVVPHKLYPPGYHVNTAEPLPFISIGNQKGGIALYHMGLYAMPRLLKWFQVEYDKHCATKLDMGKSCVRFKKPEAIPMQLIAALAKQVTVDEWITVYEKEVRNARKKK